MHKNYKMSINNSPFKLALFGRKIDDKNLNNFKLLINSLLQSKHTIEWSYYEPFYKLLSQKVSLPKGSFFHSHSNLSDDTNLFLSLGGDGTFLEALGLIRNKGILVAGINFGRLGFLTSASVGETNLWIDNLLSGNFSTIKRGVLQIEGCGNDFFSCALNEVTIQRQSPAMLEIHVSINGNLLPTYWADGILLATATGSTAYSLSLGGPIVTPDAKVLIIAPICPHNLNVRPLIVPETSQIELSFTGREVSALLTADNRSEIITRGNKITVKSGEYSLNCVMLNNNFIAALNQKLLWGEDKRNDSIKF